MCIDSDWFSKVTLISCEIFFLCLMNWSCWCLQINRHEIVSTCNRKRKFFSVFVQHVSVVSCLKKAPQTCGYITEGRSRSYCITGRRKKWVKRKCCTLLKTKRKSVRLNQPQAFFPPLYRFFLLPPLKHKLFSPKEKIVNISYDDGFSRIETVWLLWQISLASHRR